MAARDKVREQVDGGGVAVAERPSLPPILRMLTDPATEGEVAKALPAGADVKRYLRVARTAVQANPELLRCEPRSLIAAVHKAAAYGLDVGPIGQAYLVPFKNQVQLIIGYRGMLALARRSGELQSIEARAVYENDEFTYQYGLDPKLHHVPALSGRGKLIAFWGLAKFVNGGFYMVVVDLDEIEEHRRASQTGNSEKGPWKLNYASMGRKTVIRIMEPYLPLTTEVREALATEDAGPVDDTAFQYIDTTSSAPVEPEPEPEPEPYDDEPPPDT